MLAQQPANQAKRSATIRQFDLGQRLHEGKLNGLVEFATEMTGCPVALVSIVHEDAQRFEATCGLDMWETGLDSAVCAHAILQEEILEIPDCRLDPRTRDNPLVLSEEHQLRFYAGAQIRTEDGIVLGSLCVLDRVPRVLTDLQRRTLRLLADQAMRMLELYQAVQNADHLRREADHRVKNSLASIAAVARLTASRAKNEETREALQQVQARIEATSRLHAELYNQDVGEQDIEVSGYLEGIAGHLRDIAPPDVTLKQTFAQMRMPSRAMAALGLLVNEMVSNAYKHGYPDGRPGKILLTAGPIGQDTYVLRCSDDGIGPSDEVTASGLGSLLMKASATQLGGVLTQGARKDGTGFEVQVSMPAPKD
ncbi:sensor histidine kinase [Jannaschia sp. 2305UL9-9]|uniref:sensor histidine kinase n=1 Tax=Jannaschia sp. 2305UL9-9 TaxID=3121638 RepID=UPI0035273C8F